MCFIRWAGTITAYRLSAVYKITMASVATHHCPMNQILCRLMMAEMAKVLNMQIKSQSAVVISLNCAGSSQRKTKNSSSIYGAILGFLWIGSKIIRQLAPKPKKSPKLLSLKISNAAKRTKARLQVYGTSHSKRQLPKPSWKRAITLGIITRWLSTHHQAVTISSSKQHVLNFSLLAVHSLHTQMTSDISTSLVKLSLPRYSTWKSLCLHTRKLRWIKALASLCAVHSAM
ncbi:Uncharacterised protein [Chlamydia trachomatis]|nr:Uncharacterised protein [Chlamydia trachomatis]